MNTAIHKNQRARVGIAATTLFALSLSGCLGISGLQEEEVSALDLNVAEGSGGLRADYYKILTANAGEANAKSFTRDSTRVLTRIDPQVDFNDVNGAGRKPFPAETGQDFLAARWTGYFVPPVAGNYRFCTCSDDGIRLSLDGQMRIDQYADQGERFWGSGVLALEANKRYPIRLDWYDGNGNGRIELYYVLNPTGTRWEMDCNSGSSVDANGNVQYDVACDNTKRNFPAGVSMITKNMLVPAETGVAEIMNSCTPSSARLTDAQIPNPNELSTQQALKLFDRLANTKTSVYDPRVKQVAALIKSGKAKEAARVVSEDNNFLDITVRRFAAKMSTREEKADVPLNDFIATVAGVVRDRMDARHLLTANFLYRGKWDLFWRDASTFSAANVLTSNRHYLELEGMGPLKCALEKLSEDQLYSLPKGFEQTVVTPAGAATVNPDPAGLLTSRSFAEAHIIAGTNRRPVEKTFQYFMCAPIDNIRTTENTDQWIRRDVERLPNGASSFDDFLNNCASCHKQLDPLSKAFAYLHYENGRMKYGPLFNRNGSRATNNAAMETEGNMKLSNTNNETANPTANNQQGNMDVAWKMNHNSIYNDGYFVKDNSFQNTFASTTLGAKFGFVDTSGTGVREYGKMFARSQAFPRCMAKKVYFEVCRTDPLAKPNSEAEAQMLAELNNFLEGVGDQFAQNGYDMRDLFETLATTCL